MHVKNDPHCSYCEHFELCFRVDMVTEWGYCSLKVAGRSPTKEQIEALKREVEGGNYAILLTTGKELGLFLPTYTDCSDFYDLFPV